MPNTLVRPSRRLKLEAGTHKAPREAFRFTAPVGFGKFEENEDGTQSVPVSILARTPDVIDHWYLGRTVNDMAGVQVKDKIPLDWCHWWDVNVGFADEIVADETKGLMLTGKIVSVGYDQAAEILARGKAGVPYEASIEFTTPWRFEVVAEGQVAECNGQEIEGPCIIFREWTLIACAICPFGADPNTKTKFSLAGGRRRKKLREQPDEVEFTIEPETIQMAKKPATQANDETEAPADGQQLSNGQQNPSAANPSTEDAAKAFAAKLAKFTAEFGEVNGSKWAAAGKSYEEALKLHADELSAKLASQGADKDKEIDDLKAKLNAVDKGELSAVSSSEGGEGGTGKSKHAKPGSNRAKFTGALKMPVKK